jgi:hypothetical protein
VLLTAKLGGLPAGSLLSFDPNDDVGCSRMHAHAMMHKKIEVKQGLLTAIAVQASSNHQLCYCSGISTAVSSLLCRICN